MTHFPELQYRFPIVTPAGTATIDFPETQWDIAAQAAIIGPGAATVKDYLSVHGIGFYGHLFTLDAVSPMDLHHALLMNATTHHEPAIFRFDVIGYVPTENPAENDPDRWKDDEEDSEDSDGLITESAHFEINFFIQSIFESASGSVVVTLTGKELGDDNDSKVLRKKAEAYYKEHFRGTVSHRSNFKEPIRYSNKGLNEFIHFSSDPDKLRLMPALKVVIEKGDYEGREEVSHSRKDEIVAFHLIKANVSLAGRIKEVRVEIGEDTQGHLFYDLFPDRTQHDLKRAKPHQGEESESSFNAARGRRGFPSDNLNIPSSTSEVKKENIVTESATFDYRTVIQQATNFDDIQAAFQKAFPIIIPANLPDKASGINFLDTGKGKPNTVYRDIYDLYTYEHLDLISEPYDGTLESLMSGWEKVQQRLNDYHNASNSNSPIAATDANGRAKYYISSNGRFITDLQTREEINTDAYKERDVKKELQQQGFIVDTNVDGAIVSLRLAGNIALRDRYGRWKLYEGEQDEKNLIGDDFTQSEVVKEMKGMILESADREAIASGRFFTEGELRAMARRLKERDRTKADNFHKRLKAKLGQADAPTADLESSKSTIEPWQIKKAEFIVLQNNLLPDWEPGIGFYGGYEFAMPDKTTRRFDGPVYTKNLAIEVFHRESVSMAMQMGLPVPPVVLEDYPELVENVLESALTAEEIHDIAHQAATSHKNDLPEPTEAQAKAGNYKHGHLKLYGLDITIENPAGSKRSGIDPDGKPWECVIPAHYGFFKRTMGSDGDHVDCYIGESPESELVFIVDQMDLMTGCFDEHKTLLACQSEEEARNIYIAGFSDGKGPDRIGAITEMDMEEFKVWLAEGETTQPVGRITIPQI